MQSQATRLGVVWAARSGRSCDGGLPRKLERGAAMGSASIHLGYHQGWRARDAAKLHAAAHRQSVHKVLKLQACVWQAARALLGTPTNRPTAMPPRPASLPGSGALRACLNAFVPGAAPPGAPREAAIVEGVLAGAPIAVKANLCAEGWLATAGSKMLESACRRCR